MPKTKRISWKRASRFAKKYPTGRRKTFRRSKPKSKISNFHRFHRYGTTDTRVTTTNASETSFAEHFQFDQITAYTEFTSLFDTYRIDGVLLKFQLISNPDATYSTASGTALNTGNYYPKLWYCVDYDDANPLTLSAMKERGNVKCRVLRPNSFLNILIRPNILSLIYRTNLTSGYAPKPRCWIDAANVDVPHYAFKFIIESPFISTGIPNQFIVREERKFYFSVKGVI